MVRGRRVRAAVVACARPDDCCSPNAKRKDIIGNLSHTPKSQPITKYFQTVTEPTLPEDACGVGLNGTITDTSGTQHNGQGLEPAKALQPSLIPPSHTPPTPHRIQLNDDNRTATIHISLPNNDNNNQEPIQRLALTPKRFPASKARKKQLNNNQQINQQINQHGPQQNGAAVVVVPNGKKAAINGTNHAITEFFPVRRSVRKTKKIVLEEKQRNIEDLVRNNTEDGLRVQNFEGKGRGVIVDKSFEKGDFVVEYSGELIDLTEARNREQKYAQDQNTGCYMYYFNHKNKQYCIDATAETGRLGRLVNHSRTGNLCTRIVPVDNRPRLVLVARDSLEAGDEVTYDYGDRSKESLAHHPWLAY